MNMEDNITLSTRVIKTDGHEIPIQCAEITSANILSVEAGTNGFHGGDSGHGSRTHFAIEDLASTDMRISFHADKCVGGKLETDETGLLVHGVDLHCSRIEIDLGGDCELETFIQALEFAAKTLRQQAGI